MIDDAKLFHLSGQLIAQEAVLLGIAQRISEKAAIDRFSQPLEAFPELDPGRHKSNRSPDERWTRPDDRQGPKSKLWPNSIRHWLARMPASWVLRRVLDQHPDLDVAQVDSERLVSTARQLDEFAQLGVWSQLCHAQCIRIGHREMVRRDAFLHFTSLRISRVDSGILFSCGSSARLCSISDGFEAGIQADVDIQKQP
jgi:hypothetical protein